MSPWISVAILSVGIAGALASWAVGFFAFGVAFVDRMRGKERRPGRAKRGLVAMAVYVPFWVLTGVGILLVNYTGWPR